MLNQVRLLIVPIINVTGFEKNQREEIVGITTLDANRDFPYNIKKDEKCL